MSINTEINTYQIAADNDARRNKSKCSSEKNTEATEIKLYQYLISLIEL